MEESLKFFRNPIHTLKESLPELVWDHYNNKLSDAIGAMNLTQSKRNSYRQTFRFYAEGLTKGDSIYKFNFWLKEEILKVMPITNVDFFQGEPEAMEAAALETAKQMVADFEALLEEQKLKLVV